MSYDLKPVKAPKLKGLALRHVTWMAESRVFGPFLRKVMFSAAGIVGFRKRTPRAAPTLFPLVAPKGCPAQPREGTAVAMDVAGEGESGRHPGFGFDSIKDYAGAYREGSVSPEEVARRILRAVEASNEGDKPLRAIIKCDAEDILRQAADSSKRISRGQPRSILEGVPVAIKDELDMLPYTTGVGTSFLGREAPPEDATPVTRLREAGALLIGKANMYEIGISPTGNNPIHGFARNPYHLDHDAGGSSGGCGAAVGSGMVPLAIGADGGGSIRIPAAHCGVFGLKPTFGRVSEFGAAPLCWSVAHVGPLGATALDTAIGYAVCAGADPKDPMSVGQPPVHLRDFHQLDLSGVTLGIDESWFEDAAPELVENCEETIRRMEQAGAVRKKINVEGLEAIRVAHVVTILTEMAAAMEPYDAEHRKDFGHSTRLSLALARNFTNLDYVRAQRIRTDAMKEWTRVLSGVDVVLTPTTACPPPYLDPATLRYGESDLSTEMELMRFAVSANFCGLPAISIPAGYTEHGLPVGMQVIGRHWEEDLLLRLANAADHALKREKPAMFHKIL